MEPPDDLAQLREEMGEEQFNDMMSVAQTVGQILTALAAAEDQEAQMVVGHDVAQWFRAVCEESSDAATGLFMHMTGVALEAVRVRRRRGRHR